MWRPSLSAVRRLLSARALSSRGRSVRSASRLTLVSASVGVLIGAGYGGYTHYKVNRRSHIPVESTDYAFLERAPEYKPNYRVVSETDNSNLQLVLFQYRTCPFCCKVRTYLDYQGISYEVVEVDAVLRQAIKWSEYKKVPILLAKVEGGYQQLLDSTAIVSVLETYLRDKASQLRELVKFYPTNSFINNDGKKVSDVVNKYFVMHNEDAPEAAKKYEKEEREWRQWADAVLVHALSPNVYRTLGEAFQAFEWFAVAGRWRENFPAWECALMVNVGAVAMWLISKRLKTRHNLHDDVRLSLYEAADKWTRAIEAKGTRFMGGERPNLADLSVYGVLSSIEGCDAFQDLRAHTRIGGWFDDTKRLIDSRRGQVVVLKN